MTPMACIHMACIGSTRGKTSNFSALAYSSPARSYYDTTRVQRSCQHSKQEPPPRRPQRPTHPTVGPVRCRVASRTRGTVCLPDAQACAYTRTCMHAHECTPDGDEYAVRGHERVVQLSGSDQCVKLHTHILRTSKHGKASSGKHSGG